MHPCMKSTGTQREHIIYQMTMRVMIFMTVLSHWRVMIFMKVLSHWPPQHLKLQNWHPPRLMKTTIWITRRPHQVTENSSFLRIVWISFSSFVPSVGEYVTLKITLFGQCWLFLGFVSVGRRYMGITIPNWINAHWKLDLVSSNFI